MTTLLVVTWGRLTASPMPDDKPTEISATNYDMLIMKTRAAGRWLPRGFKAWLEERHHHGDTLEARYKHHDLTVAVTYRVV